MRIASLPESKNLHLVAGLSKLLSFKQSSEAATAGVLQKKVFLKIFKNAQENTCVGVSFLIKLDQALELLMENNLTQLGNQMQEIQIKNIFDNVDIYSKSFVC